MKSRLLDVMGNALTLVRKSNLVEATALLRKTLGGDAVAALAERGRRPAADFPSSDQAEPTRSATASTTPAARTPLGDVVRALRAGRAPLPRTPFAPDERPAYPLDDKFT